MLNPSELYRFETDTDPQELRASVMVVVPRRLHGRRAHPATAHRPPAGHVRVAPWWPSFDVDQLVDYRGRRPGDGLRHQPVGQLRRPVPGAAPARPTVTARRTSCSTGPEPDYQWERVTEAVRQLVVMPRRHPRRQRPRHPDGGAAHAARSGMTAHATDPRLIPVQRQPASAGSRCRAAWPRCSSCGSASPATTPLGFAVHVPHYLAQAEFADGAVTRAQRDHRRHRPQPAHRRPRGRTAGLNRAEIAREVEGSDEVAQVVAALERQYDTFMRGAARSPACWPPT